MGAVAKHTDPLSSLLLDKNLDANVAYDEPLSAHTIYGIGGLAEYFIVANSISALQSVLRACKAANVEWFLIGKGSNLLVSDDGFRGAVIQLGRDFRKFAFDEDNSLCTVGAGVSLGHLTQEAFIRSIHGLEFSVGIPGSLGGALFMNAGSKDCWIGEKVKSVTYLSTLDGFEMKKISGNDIEWGYRSSSLSKLGIAIECELQIEKDLLGSSKNIMEASLKKRQGSQPNLRSCGSVFKNPPGYSVGKLIEDAGLKGRSVGGARISEIHANFIVNEGNASARDVLELINLIKTTILEKNGIKLECEVKMLGF